MADRKQARTRRRSGFIDLVNAVLTLLVLAVLVAGGLALYGAHSFYAPGPMKTATTFTVEKGNNLGTVAERLEQAGIIDNRYVFEIGGVANKKQGQLKAGEFKIAANASMDDVLKALTEGKPIQHGITIPEGFTIAQVVDRLNKSDELTGELTTIPPEGGILPETYMFEPGASRQSVLDRMVAAQEKAVADAWAGRDRSLPLATPQQLVTLASIVEKETGVAGERGHVAAVFANRLEKHMRLQSDPTVIYGITKGAASLGRPLKRSELEAETPYNTYQIDGLPPTPIDNPGLDALKATANPDRSNDIYFVAESTNPADGHLFAATYADHRRNVAKFRAAEKVAAASEAADAEAAKEQLEEQQAAEAGDKTADQPADNTPAPATSGQPANAPAPAPAGPAASAAPAPAAPASPAPAAGSPAPAAAAPVTAAATPAGSAAPAVAATTPADAQPVAASDAQPAGAGQPGFAELPPPGTIAANGAPIPLPASARPAASTAATQADATPEKPPARASRPAKPKPAAPADENTFGG
ncbi:MAG TPA: endolytic transglycosylase MltG [Devosia sp.]|nr:endolytic transglycosylase MltG [Devosia sp.]